MAQLACRMQAADHGWRNIVAIVLTLWHVPSFELVLVRDIEHTGDAI